MNKCKECGSYAINPGRRGRDDSDLDLCDVCYWRVRAERLQAIVDADNRRFAWLAGADADCGPVIEGFSVLLDDFWSFLCDAIRERIGEENDSPDIEGTDEDRIKAFQAMVDAAIAAEEARKP